MNTKENFPRDTLEQALTVYKGWKKYQAELHVPNFSMEEFEDRIKSAQDGVEMVEKIRKERSEAVSVRDDSLRGVWDLVKRVRNAAKATFGDDSEEIIKFKLKNSRKPKK